MNRIITLAVQRSASIKVARCFCSQSGTGNQNEKTTVNYAPVYKFDFIVPLAIVNQLKAYQTAITAVAVPTTLALNQLDLVSSEITKIVTAIGVSGCLSLYTLGLVANNFIGVIYYDEANEMVKVSYLDFWGKRKNLEIPTNDIVPLAELPRTPMQSLYVTFRRFSTKKTFKLCLRMGTILDAGKLQQFL